MTERGEAAGVSIRKRNPEDLSPPVERAGRLTYKESDLPILTGFTVSDSIIFIPSSQIFTFSNSFSTF